MADSFDPYQEWLGISPFEPPPNHYRLLGLRPFEDSVDVIQQTVIRLMARIKGLAADQPESVTRRVLADLAAARDCLVNPETRAAYDLTLREKAPSLAAAQATAAANLSPATPGTARAATPGQDMGETVMFQAGSEDSDASSTDFVLGGSPTATGGSTIGGGTVGGSAIGSSPSMASATGGASGVNLSAAAGQSGAPKAKLIGDYVVLEKIGAGGMGQVFKARHRKLKRIVAVKVLPPQSITSLESVRRFYREVESAAKLNHPNIVAAFDAGEQHGIHYLVMEFVDGKDLSQILKQTGTLNVPQVVDYIRQAAAGLAYAHREGIVHRDIKPANLLLDKEGRIKILDMGLASNDQSITLAGSAAKGLTTTGQIMGTVDYMSPEQAEDTHQADARSDVYSLGCTMYRLLTGEVPYQGETVMKKIFAHRSAPLPALREARKDVPPALEAVFQKMIAKSPADRYQSMQELMAALETCLKVEPASPPRPMPPPLKTRPPQAARAKPQAAAPESKLPDFLASSSFVQGAEEENDSGAVSLSLFMPTAAPAKPVEASPKSPASPVPLPTPVAGNSAAVPVAPGSPPARSAAPPVSPSKRPPELPAKRDKAGSAVPPAPEVAKPIADESAVNPPRNWFVIGGIAGGMVLVSLLLLLVMKLLHG